VAQSDRCNNQARLCASNSYSPLKPLGNQGLAGCARIITAEFELMAVSFLLETILDRITRK
jgi:hypothetical protein